MTQIPLRLLLFAVTLGVSALLFSSIRNRPTLAALPPFQATNYPVCAQLPLTPPVDIPPAISTLNLSYTVYLPLVSVPVMPPACSVYCGLALENDPYRPAGFQTYFADEFDCDQLLPYWNVQSQMTAASYIPPQTGYVEVNNGTLKIGVPGQDTSFPYLYLVDDSATTYDIPHSTAAGGWVPRVDWLPNDGDFQITMRVRFNVEAWGEHRIAIYADGHRPSYAGPLFYIGSDANAQEEAWRGLIVGADRGNNFFDLGNAGYADPYTGWVIVTVEFNISADTLVVRVDGFPYITKPLSSFQGYPHAAIRPDILYLGSLALLEHPASWTDIEVDWLRVYVPAGTPNPPFGLIDAAAEDWPVPTDAITKYAAPLSAGPFANTPYWYEDFDDPDALDYWHMIQYPDPLNAWSEVANSSVALRNNGSAIGVPVWAIFDDLLPLEILAAQEDRELAEDYLRRRGGSPFFPSGNDLTATNIYTRTDWRPNEGNVRYAWRGRQTANGYGVEISNGGHVPYFTGAMFYTLQDTTSNGGQGQFIFPACQEQYFWRLHQLPGYQVPHHDWTIVTADYINGTVHLFIDGHPVGWWPESDCSLNWYLQGQNATSPDVLFFGNPATAPGAGGSWSEIYIDWFATFPGLPRVPRL